MNKFLLATVLSFSVFTFSNGQGVVPSSRIKTFGKADPSVIIDGSGNILVFGFYNDVNNVYHGRLTKLLPTGIVDNSFLPVLTDTPILDAKILPTGQILVAGFFTKVNGLPCNGVVRLNSNGSLDNSFTGTIPMVVSLQVQSTGKILILTSDGISRLNSDGSTDASFIKVRSPSIRGMVITSNDEIYSYSSISVDKFLANGSEDVVFTKGVTEGQISTLSTTWDGKIFVGGSFTKYNSVPASSVIKIDANGQIDNSFKIIDFFSGQVLSILERANKQVVIGGSFSHFASQTASLVVLKETGALDRIGGVVSTNWITKISELPDQSLIINGQFDLVNGKRFMSIAKFTPNAVLDETFSPTISFNNPNGRSIAVTSYGSSIATGGDFYGIIQSNEALLRKTVFLNPFGRVQNASKDFNVVVYIDKAVYQADDKLLVSGSFSNSLSSLARFTATGAVDPSFNSGTGPTYNGFRSLVSDFKIRPEGIYIAGRFNSYNAVATTNLALLNYDGSLKKAYTVFPSGSTVSSIDFQASGKVVAVVTFDDGTTKIFRINVDGTIDNLFRDNSFPQGTYQVKIDASDRIYALSRISGKRIVRMLRDGGTDFGFLSGAGVGDNSSELYCMETLPSGGFAFGGYIVSYDNQQRYGLAILNSAGQLSNISLPFGPGSCISAMVYKNNALYISGSIYPDDGSEPYGIAKISLGSLTPPVAPSNVVTSLASLNMLRVTWKDNSDNEVGFVVERSDGKDAPYSVVDTVWLNTTVINDLKGTPYKDYSYRVSAINEFGVSPSRDFQWEAITEVEPAKSNEVIVYPSPVKSLLYLKGDISLTTDDFEVINLNGQSKMLPARREANEISIDVSGLSEGLYIIRIPGKSVYTYKKIMKIHP